MSRYNMNVLADAKEEYTRQLISVLTPEMYVGIKSIYDAALKHCNKVNDKNILKKFQILLSSVPQWNQSKVDDEFIRIVKKTDCDFIEDLITAVFVSHTKVLSSIQLKKNNKTIPVNVPMGAFFIHKCYIQCARNFWRKAWLLDSKASSIDIQRNVIHSETLINESIKETIRKLLPVRHILKEYLNQDFKDDDIVDNIEDSLTKSTKENLRKLVRSELQTLSKSSIDDNFSRLEIPQESLEVLDTVENINNKTAASSISNESVKLEDNESEKDELSPTEFDNDRLDKEELIREELAIEELAKEELAKEELAKEELPIEEIAKEELPIEELAKEELAKEELPIEELAKEELAKEKLAKEELAKEELAKEELAIEELAREELAKEELAKEKLAKEELAKEELAKEELEREDMVEENNTKPVLTKTLVDEKLSKDVISENTKIIDMNGGDKKSQNDKKDNIFIEKIDISAEKNIEEMNQKELLDKIEKVSDTITSIPDGTVDDNISNSDMLSEDENIQVNDTPKSPVKNIEQIKNYDNINDYSNLDSGAQELKEQVNKEDIDNLDTLSNKSAINQLKKSIIDSHKSDNNSEENFSFFNDAVQFY